MIVRSGRNDGKILGLLLYKCIKPELFAKLKQNCSPIQSSHNCRSNRYVGSVDV